MCFRELTIRRCSRHGKESEEHEVQRGILPGVGPQRKCGVWDEPGDHRNCNDVRALSRLPYALYSSLYPLPSHQTPVSSLE